MYCGKKILYSQMCLCAIYEYIYFSCVAYKDLQSREETRNAAWLKEGWDVSVHYTGEKHTLLSTAM